jgi:mono/diheme cytochrome c family protein
MAQRWPWFGFGVLPMVAAAWMGQSTQVPDYAKKVEPIIKSKCLRCHTGPKSQGGLDMSTTEGWRKGGVSGKVLGPYLISRILGTDGKQKMPLGGTLSAAEVDTLKSWVQSGANLPKPTPRFSEVQAIFKAHCNGCHTGTSAAGRLNLTEKVSLERVVKAGDAEHSSLMRRMLGLDGKPSMPKGFAPLSAEKLATVRGWIQGGAKYDSGETKLWSYEPITKPAVPIAGEGWAINAVDRFIAAKHREVGLQPSARAEETALIRRASLDITGLPPSKKTLEQYFLRPEKSRYEEFVDEQLRSIHFGERQAGYWLDLSRYADTNGFEKDGTRSAWRYRDWLIHAFNQNKPYDQFVIEQVAGDMIPQATRDQIVATGFHRNSMLNLEGGVDQDEARHYVIVDRVNTTATAFMGTTLACARCHDHKFDPISQKDYYGLYALMGNTDYTPVGDANISEQKYIEPFLDFPDDVDYLKSLQADRAKATSPSVIQELDRAVTRTQSSIQNGRALVVREKKTKGPLKAWLLNRGEWLGKKELVTASVPKSLPNLQGTVNRYTFAKWLVRPDNPLTARVQVNRVWAQYFGRGIVATLDDFGTQGAKPSHPELLDWLSNFFIESGWDMKALHRKILLSATYRQSSKFEPTRTAKDPTNEWLSRMSRRRLEAETIRDTMLSVSGLLYDKVGGPSVFPKQPQGVWNSPYSGERWEVSSGANAYRRGIYTFIKRTAPYPSFIAFDATSREECTVNRGQTNTPLQALVMMNDETIIEASHALAERLRRTYPDSRRQIRLGFQLCTSRFPTESEFEKLRELHRGQDNRLPLVALTLLNMDETITRD